MKLIDLIAEYNLQYRSDLERRQQYLKDISIDEFWDSLRDFGKIRLDGNTKTNSHFKNNLWFNKIQINKSGKAVQFRDALIKSLKTSKVFDNKRIDTFDDVYNMVSKIIDRLNKDGVKGASQMTKYDISLYISSRKGFGPERVYVHRGVRTGAYSLNLIDKISEDRILETQEVFKKCPGLLKIKEPKHLENFLCIFKNQLAQLRLN